MKTQEKILVFLNYCEELIKDKQQQNLIEEEIGSMIINRVIQNDLWDQAEIKNIIEAAINLEIPGEISYAQEMGSWDQKVDNKIKTEEWITFINTAIYTRKNISGK